MKSEEKMKSSPSEPHGTNDEGTKPDSQKDLQKSPQSLKEEVILKFWDDAGIFEKTLKKDSPRGEFVFYDGPPYATGLPHFGHILPSTIKDAFPRFKTMQGYHVNRKWGWDCHGLPIENIIEKKLGLADKKAIIDYGIDKFNRAARESVLEYDKEWQKIIHRLGRWVDMENAYHTMDSSYTESVWWSFKELFNKGLVYEGFRVMQICPRCETTLSNHEIGQGYKDVQDISVYALFELKNGALPTLTTSTTVPTSAGTEKDTTDTTEPKTYFLAWTTTPWTLHGNAALAVNPDLTYVKVKTIRAGNNDGEKITIILAESRLFIVKNEYEIIERIQGKDLVGQSYAPVFNTYTKIDINGKATEFSIKDHESRRANAWKVYAGDFVTDDSGTGIVHIAPAFGDDDYKLGEQYKLPLLQHVTFHGIAKEELGPPFAGMAVKEIENPQAYDIEVIKALAQSGLLFAKEKITHSYPHCWRCNTPLLNYATSAWFIEMTKLQNRLIEENKKVKWIPESIGSGRFGTWLENLRDWNISRTRFWGAPLPVWKGVKTGTISVLGSIEELKSHIEKRNSFTIMRHGEAESNILGVISSRDLNAHGLTEVGRGEVQASITNHKAKLNAEGKKITKIFASDFRRTRETAEYTAEILGIPKENIIFDQRLRECLAGGMEGKTLLWAEHWALFKSRNEKMFMRAPSGGESIFDIKTRATEFMYEIDATHKDEDILIITHGLPLRMIAHTALGRSARDLVRIGWSDVSDPTASLHEIDWRALPHNESFELDLHRPYVDQIKWTNPETGEEMARVPEVFDVWYDSGSMPFAQNHYPFEQKEEFEKWKTNYSSLFPANFIAEGLDQTRGWFYTLMSLGVGLFDKSPYETVIVNGLILAEDGRKMSKSLNNYPPLMTTVDKYGADSLRYFLASSPATHGEEVAFTEKGLDEVNKKIFNRLDNMYAFLKMYAGSSSGPGANAASGSRLGAVADLSSNHSDQFKNVFLTEDEIKEKLKSISHPLDLWILSRLNQLINIVTKNFEAYLIAKATRPINEFVDDLSTWYVRRSRDRFKQDGADRDSAIFITKFVLEKLALLMAPVTPFIAEDLYQKVRFEKPEIESVHLREWPLPVLFAQFTHEGFEDKIISEMSTVRDLVLQGLSLRAEAKIKVRQPLAVFEYTTENTMLDSEMEEIIKDELNVKVVRRGNAIILDTAITEELKQEGAVRDLIRAVQEERKNQDMNPQDSITLMIRAGADTEVIIKTFEDMLLAGVSAGGVVFSHVQAEPHVQEQTQVPEKGPAETEGLEVPFLEEKISFIITK